MEEDEEEEDGYSSQLRQELLYNVSGLKGKTTISPIEFTGFIAWLLLTIAVMMFTLWAWAPDELFDRHFKHIPLFPSRHYMLCFGNWLGMFIVVYHISLHCISMIKSPPRESYHTLIDRHTRLAIPIVYN